MEYRHIDLYITYEIGYSMNIHVSMAHLISSSLPSFLCFRGELIGEFQIWSTDALLVLFNCIHLNWDPARIHADGACLPPPKCLLAYKNIKWYQFY